MKYRRILTRIINSLALIAAAAYGFFEPARGEWRCAVCAQSFDTRGRVVGQMYALAEQHRKIHHDRIPE